MRLNEATAAARRIGPLLALDANGDPVTGETFNGAGELEVDIAGAGWSVPTGSIVEIGDGYYYYQATAADCASRPYVAIKLSGACEEFTFREDVTTELTGIVAGETDPALRRVGPLLAELNDVAVTGETFNGAGELEVSVNGSAWAAATGTITEMSDGYYYYTPSVAELADHGWISVKLSGVCDEFTMREDVSIARTVLTNESDAADIIERILVLLEGISPTSLGTKIIRYRAEDDSDFRRWATQNNAAAFRRVHVREVGTDDLPETSSVTEERVRMAVSLELAYPHSHRYGAQNALDRDRVLKQDWKKINAAIGIYGRANFTGSYDCTPLGATEEREQEGGVDFMVVTAEYEYIRATA